LLAACWVFELELFGAQKNELPWLAIEDEPVEAKAEGLNARTENSRIAKTESSLRIITEHF
jgi:hypothetical protein